ncbi:MAG: 6-phospho-beta-glucosidase [Bacilli bacterium]|nr:6-phospho-beta-glucosidase [Bacilli bacterium]
MSKEAIKIVTIGGGSSYAPELMEGFIKRYDELPIKEIWLVDIEEGKEKLNIVGAMAQRMWDAKGYDVKIHLTLDRRAALKGADFVTTQFRVGLLDARIKDERIPALHGLLGQETNGAGGIFKAFRTIPVIKAIIDDMRELCPHAWLINFTNPSGMISEAIIKHFHWQRCIGLCNVPVLAMMGEHKSIHMPRESLHYHFAGLNHFHWHKVYDDEGNDITCRILEKFNDPDFEGKPANLFKTEFPLELLMKSNMIPCMYHSYYYTQEETLAHALEEFKLKGTRAQQMKEVESELFALYKQPELDHKPEQLSKRGGAYYSDAACECISAIYNDKQSHMVVSTENKGALPFLASDSIVEVSSIIGARGACPMVWGNMPPAEKGWLQTMKAMEECVIEAALTGDYGMALEAFTINPLIPGGKIAKMVLNELLIAHKKYLPQFQQVIEHLEKQGVKINDEQIKNLI